MTDRRRKDPTQFWHTPARLLPRFAGQPGQACTDADPELFFSTSSRDQEEARRICNTGPCRWRVDCLEFALAISPDKDHGVWGGTTVEERQSMRPTRISKPVTSETPVTTAEQRIDQAAECLRLWRDGKSLAAIGREFGFSTGTVKRRLRQALFLCEGDPLQPPKLSPHALEQRSARAAHCLDLWRGGMTIAAIAQELGVGHQTVRRRLRQAEREAEQAPAA